MMKKKNAKNAQKSIRGLFRSSSRISSDGIFDDIFKNSSQPDEGKSHDDIDLENELRPCVYNVAIICCSDKRFMDFVKTLVEPIILMANLDGYYQSKFSYQGTHQSETFNIRVQTSKPYKWIQKWADCVVVLTDLSDQVNIKETSEMFSTFSTEVSTDLFLSLKIFNISHQPDSYNVSFQPQIWKDIPVDRFPENPNFQKAFRKEILKNDQEHETSPS